MYPPAYDFPIALKMNSTKKSAETTFFVPKGIFFCHFCYTMCLYLFLYIEYAGFLGIAAELFCGRR